MKIGSKILFLLNLCLAGVLIFVLAHRERESRNTRAPAQTIPLSAPAQAVESKPFQWSQLEPMDDYRGFVANLRAAGCPEPTVEDIVRGDTGRAFSMKRQQLNLDGSGTGPWSQQREMSVVASLLGRTEPVASISDEPIQKQVPSPRASAPPVYPLAFQNVNLDALELKAGQKEAVMAAVAGVQQQFINQMGGANQDPSDPAYLERWRKAQSQVDNTLRGFLGGKTFMAYQLAAQTSPQNAATTTP
jgi:hypothetical protein